MGRRLLFLLSAFDVGGAERQTIDLARQLVARGHDCRFLLFHRRYSDNIADAEVLERTTFVDSGYKMLDPRSFKATWRAIADVAPEIILGVNATPTLLAAWGRARGRYSAGVIGTMHSSKLMSMQAKVHVRLLRATLPLLDGFVFVSHNQRKYWEARGLRSKTAEVIHNGVDLARFGQAPDDAARADAKQRLGFAADDFVAGLLATFRPEKHHQQLVDAVGLLRQQGVPAKAMFIGGGPTRAAVEAHTASLGLGDHVLFAGEQSDVRPFVSALDVGVLCSVAVEALSVAALEMMAMGVPMVMTDIGGASEIVRDGVNGYLFPASDTDALVTRLQSLSDPGLRSAMSIAAQTTVREHFSNALMTDRYEALFERVAMQREAAQRES